MKGGVLSGLPDVELSFSADDIRPSREPDTGLAVGDVSRHGEPVELSPR